METVHPENFVMAVVTRSVIVEIVHPMDIDFEKNNFAALSVRNGRKRPIPSLLPCEMNFLKVYSRNERRIMKRKHEISYVSFLVLFLSLLAAVPATAKMDITQTLSDDARRTTIAFDGFVMITGTFESQTFFPPGKVADYWGFQYLRDNTADGNGHNTSFLTNCAFNVLYILSADQFAMLKTLAAAQVDQINLYGYKRYPLMKAFHRQLDGDIPSGSTGLSLDAVKAFSADLYQLDGQISFDRAVVYATFSISSNFVCIETEKAQYSVSLRLRCFTQYQYPDFPAQYPQIICAGLCLRYPRQGKNRIRATRADRIQPDIIPLGPVFSKYLAVVHVMADQFFQRPGIQRLTFGLVGQQIMP
jgi:hypothetical protein